MTDPDTSLELSAAEQRAMVEAATDRITSHLESLADQPAVNLDDATEVAESLREPLPEEPTPYDELLDLLFEEAIPRSANTLHPGYLAYIPGGGLFHAAVADLIANATNRYVGAAFAAPALVQLEANVIEWLCTMVEYPDEAFGVLTTGGSLANQTAVTVARRERLTQAFQDGVVYTSDQAHHSVTKASVLAGFPPDHVRAVPTDEDYRLRPDALEARVREDRRAGKRPFLVVAAAGTTNTGAVDPLADLADYCATEDLWLHADAAYGGFFALTDAGHGVLDGLERCDSITLDPHKGLFLPYGTGAVLVRDGQALARAHATTADYLPDWEPGDTGVDFSRLSPELSRDFRGLRVWLPLKMHGIEPFRANLAEKLDLAGRAANQLAALEHVRLVAPPQLSTLAVRVEPPGLAGSALDALNHAVLDAINRRGRVFLSGTTLDGRYTIRVSVLCFRTHQEHIDHLVEDFDAALADTLPDHA